MFNCCLLGELLIIEFALICCLLGALLIIEFVFHCCLLGALLKAALICAGVVNYPSDVPLNVQLQQKYGSGFEMESWSQLPHGSGLYIYCFISVPLSYKIFIYYVAAELFNLIF